jgi:hypothetical protein
VVDLLMLTRGVTLPEALGAVAEVLPGLAPVQPRIAPQRDAAAIWDRLAKDDDAGGRYVRSRGLSSELVRYNVGGTGDEWVDRKAARGYRMAVALRDRTGKVTSIQFRCINPTVTPSKLNLPGISTTGLAIGDPHLISGETVNVCEGLADTLAVRLATGERTLGAPGADQLNHLVPFLAHLQGSNIKLWPQNDDKSRLGFSLLRNALLTAGLNVQVVQTPAALKDPALWWEKDQMEPPEPSTLPPPALSVIQGGAAPELAEDDPLASEPLTNNYSSLCRILRTPALRKMVLKTEEELAFDEMSLMPCVGEQPLKDVDLLAIRERAEIVFRGPKQRNGLKFTRQDVTDAVLQVASEKSFHPVRRYLDGLIWDGKPRLATLAQTHLNTENNAMVASILRRWFISAVARAQKPGCQVDTVLVLVGPQGHRKSSMFRVLAGKWFSDSAMVIGDKDGYLNLHSAWIYEWAELEAMQRARDHGTIKAFITSPEDTLRQPYGRATARYPRTCVIVGTTNDQEFLSDPSGNRRYWTVPVPECIDIDLLTQDRDQLWAEAMHAFRQGEPWFLTDEEDEALREAHEAYTVRDAWEDDIKGFAISHAGRLTTAIILEKSVGKPKGSWTRGDEMRVGTIMRRLGYVRRRTQSALTGDRTYLWEKANPDPF